MALLLLGFAQLSAVFALPAAGTKPEAVKLDERAVSISTDLQPTISYSTAITSLQSVTISVLPSITGVCIRTLNSSTHEET
jgi:endo-1,3(4)-beta-glucanase